MSRDGRPSITPTAAVVQLQASGDAGLVTISGLIDERFAGFGQLGDARTLVIHVGGITRMTSFGVRQWLAAMNALPKSIAAVYLFDCPTFFVDQLNMVLNFGGSAKVVTVRAPYTCPMCGVDSAEVVDVLAERATLTKTPPERECSRCSAKLEFDETAESYFAFASKYGATAIQPAAAQLLSAHGLYTASGTADKPPRVLKLVRGPVTYFRITGTIGSSFRARPFLVGAEGEVVLDLAEVERFEPSGLNEWRRLVKTLAQQVSAVTLVDLSEQALAIAGETLSIARNVSVASLLVKLTCVECRRTSQASESMTQMGWPPQFLDRVCSTCGGTTQVAMSVDALAPLQRASTNPPPASAKVVEQRDEMLSRALTDASIAGSGSSAPQVITDETVLGKYKILRRLSAGGMAEVFLAKQIGIGGFEKQVAIKRIQNKLFESLHQAIELFLNEAKIAGRLQHPNIVQVLDVGESGGALYLAMEYVHGRDLRDVLKLLQRDHAVIPLPEACYIVREVAQALHYAYWSTDMTGKQLSVVHRDVSPHNVMLGYDGSVKLLDFGVAMSAVTEHAESLIVGKWTYMSPETTMNGQADHRSDLFSLGVILYLLCSGFMPFSGSEPKQIVKKIRAGEYKPLAEIAPHVPDAIANLVTRLLDPNPENRPQHGQEVVADLDEVVRACGLESSSQKIGELLTNLFPPQVMQDAERQGLRELVRADKSTPMPGGKTTVEHSGSNQSPSPLTSTPSARTNSRFALSETFKRDTISQSISPSGRRNRVTEIVQARREAAGPRKDRRGTLINVLFAVAIFALIGVAGYLVLTSI